MDTSSYIPRTYLDNLTQELQAGQKIILIYGPRQVGKTTLARQVLSELPGKKLMVNADEYTFKEILSSRSAQRLGEFIEDHDILLIDEAQRIPDIGINLKILHDQFPKLKLLVTGSSSLELANRTQEALTGRKLTYQLYPISISELKKQNTHFELKQQLESHLIYGMYPEILSTKGTQRKIRYLRELVSSYLYKDVLELTNIKHADKLTNLLRLLAFQVGSQVSLSELGKQLGMAKETVETYLDLLEKSFVIFRLKGFSRNLRKEVTKMSKYYFYDVGVRNMLIENFNPLDARNDVGQLWENFLLVERKKSLAYTFSFGSHYFWRTYDQQEIDYIEEAGGQLAAYKFKFQKRSTKAPKAWKEAYPQASFQLIHPENYLDFLLLQGA